MTATQFLDYIHKAGSVPEKLEAVAEYLNDYPNTPVFDLKCMLRAAAYASRRGIRKYYPSAEPSPQYDDDGA